MDRNRIANFTLRIGVAFAFLYAAMDGFYDPYSWIDYFPQFVTNIAQSLGISTLFLLRGLGVIEIIIALWILSGRRIAIPSVIAALMLVTIVLFNVVQFQLLFRDLSIAAAALTLAIWEYGQP